MLSISMLFENVPEHPNTIIVKNQFYPDGLTQQQIYNYYIKNKSKILEQVKDREVMIFFATDLNKVIVKRLKNQEYIKLNSINYNTEISGRTLSLISTMHQQENFGIVDIDYHDFDIAKNVAAELYDYLYNLNKNLKIYFTGKDSFHIHYFFNKKYDIDQIRINLKDLLQDLADKYHINFKRSENKPNLDLSPNKFRGGFITPFSLSILGLRCFSISRNNLLSFNKIEAKII